MSAVLVRNRFVYFTSQKTLPQIAWTGTFMKLDRILTLDALLTCLPQLLNFGPPELKSRPRFSLVSTSQRSQKFKTSETEATMLSCVWFQSPFSSISPSLYLSCYSAPKVFALSCSMGKWPGFSFSRCSLERHRDTREEEELWDCL